MESEEMMKEALDQLESSPEFRSIMEKMMDSLLSKDVLYEPIKQMQDKFPEWLAANKGKVPQEDYDRYTKQYEYVQRLCAIYDSDPNNLTQVMTIMQEMQEHGQPPPDIVQELAPGFSFGSDGTPQLPELEELFAAGEGKDKCCLM